MTLVDSRRFIDTEEPFIMATQAKQVFYVVDNIDHQWRVVVQGKRNMVGVDDVVDEEDYNVFDNTPSLCGAIQPVGDGETVVDDEVYDPTEGTFVDIPTK